MKPIRLRTLTLTATLATLALSTALSMTSARASTLTPDDLRNVAPALDRYARERIAGDLWKRPDLSPRDRSLVTVSSLIASGQVAQLTGHLNIGMNNGLTQTEIAETITHLAFYVGWPNVFSAMPVAKDVFEKRPR